MSRFMLLAQVPSNDNDLIRRDTKLDARRDTILERLRAHADDLAEIALFLAQKIEHDEPEHQAVNESSESSGSSESSESSESEIEDRLALVIGPEARWVVPPTSSSSTHSSRVDLLRYGARRRILNHLAMAHEREPGSAIRAEALIEIGWPGERMNHTAGLVRVYSAIRRLRRLLALESILITRDDGYLLDPRVNVQRSLAPHE